MRLAQVSALALWLAMPAGAGAEVSWLAAEVRAQEARWAAQQGQPLSQPTARHPARVGRLPPAGGVIHPPRVVSRPSSQPVPQPLRTERTEEKTTLARLILVHAQQQQVDPLLVKAVILTESANRPWATSPRGAMGLMQLMPATARRFGVADPYDPAQNIAGGTRYLRWLLDYFGGSVTLALAGYNAGEGKVDRFGGIPPYWETQNYVKTVQRNHRLLSQWLTNRLAGRTEFDPPQ